jgi:hypothetical protein
MENVKPLIKKFDALFEQLQNLNLLENHVFKKHVGGKLNLVDKNEFKNEIIDLINNSDRL